MSQDARPAFAPGIPGRNVTLSRQGLVCSTCSDTAERAARARAALAQIEQAA